MKAPHRREVETDLHNRLDQFCPCFENGGDADADGKAETRSGAKPSGKRRSANNKSRTKSLPRVSAHHEDPNSSSSSAENKNLKAHKPRSMPKRNPNDGILESLMLSPRGGKSRSRSRKTSVVSGPGMLSIDTTPEATKKNAGLSMLDFNSNHSLVSAGQNTDETPPSTSQCAQRRKMIKATSSTDLWAAGMNSKINQQRSRRRRSSLGEGHLQTSHSMHAGDGSSGQTVSNSRHRHLSGSYRSTGTEMGASHSPPTSSSALDRRKKRHQLSVSQHKGESEPDESITLENDSSQEIILRSPRPILQSYKSRSPAGRRRLSSPSKTRSHSEPRRRPGGRRTMIGGDSGILLTLQQLFQQSPEQKPRRRPSNENNISAIASTRRLLTTEVDNNLDTFLQSPLPIPQEQSVRSPAGRRRPDRLPLQSPVSCSLARSHSEPRRRPNGGHGLSREGSEKRLSLQQQSQQYQEQRLRRRPSDESDNSASSNTRIISLGRKKRRSKAEGPPPTRSSSGLRHSLTPSPKPKRALLRPLSSPKQSTTKGRCRSSSNTSQQPRRRHSSTEAERRSTRRSLSRTGQANSGRSLGLS
eukprot:scaffold2659_cov107-Cylindrotheca_fusiformis.AAC.1